MRIMNTLPMLALVGCGLVSGAAEDPDARVEDAQASNTFGVHWLEERVANADALAEINREEAQLQQIQSSVVAPLKAALLEREPGAAGVLASARLVEQRKVRDADGLSETRWALGGDASEDAPTFGAWLASVAAVDHAALDVVRFVPSADAATLNLRLDLRSRADDGARQHDRAELELALEQVDGSWHVATVRSDDWTRLAASASRLPAFEDATASLGLAEVPKIDRREAIRRGGYALASTDFDGDGRVDVLVGHFESLQLLRQTESGAFEDVTAQAGLRGETKVKAAAFADIDNDGHSDLLLVRFVPGGVGMESEFVAYRNRGDGTFEHLADPLTKGRSYDRSMPIALADFNLDGNLDVYIGFPGVQDFTNLPKDEPVAELVRQGMWFGAGDWTFGESELVSPGNADKLVYPHAAMVADLNGDGYDDLIIVDDRGNDNPIYLNDGRGGFVDATGSTGLALGGWGMGAVVGDFDGDGHLDVFMTNVDFPTRERLRRSFEGRGSEATQQAIANMERSVRSNALFRNRGDGTFEDVTEAAGLAWAGAGAAVPHWVDYNNDGHLDLYVPNGLWSGGEQDFESTFVRAVAAGVEIDIGLMDGNTDKQVAVENPGLMMLRNFRGVLGDASAPHAEAPTLSLAGAQRNALFRNNGDGTFTEVGYLEGADMIEDGYVASVADVNRDGRPDLILRNCDGSPGRLGTTLTVLRNQHDAGHSLGVTVQGTRSNSDGLGTVIVATVNGNKIVRSLTGAAGAVQSEPLVHIGMGDAETIDTLEVRFPSGHVQVFHGVPSGRVHIVEGQVDLERVAALQR